MRSAQRFANRELQLHDQLHRRANRLPSSLRGAARRHGQRYGQRELHHNAGDRRLLGDGELRPEFTASFGPAAALEAGVTAAPRSPAAARWIAPALWHPHRVPDDQSFPYGLLDFTLQRLRQQAPPSVLTYSETLPAGTATTR